MATEYYISEPVTVGRAYRIGRQSGQGRFIVDGAEGRYLVAEIGKTDLGLVRDTPEARALAPEYQAETWVSRARILGDERCIPLATADGSTPAHGPRVVPPWAVSDVEREEEALIETQDYVSACMDFMDPW